MGSLITRMTCIALALFFSGSIALSARAQEVKIGIVDTIKVIELSSQGKKASEEMASKLKSAREDLEERGAELSEMKEEIESRAMTLPAEVLAKKEQTYQDENLEYQRKLEDYEETLNTKRKELNQRVSDLILGVTERIAKEGGYSLILERTASGVLYCSPSVDLTDMVIEELNKK